MMTIGSGLKDVDASAFLKCFSLTDFDVDDNNPYLKGNGGMLLNKKQNVLIAYPSAQGELPVLPDNIDTIAPMAFAYCDSLVSISVTKNIVSIDDKAFAFCMHLKSVYSEHKNPLPVSQFVFMGVPLSSGTLYVPVGSKGNYQTASCWRDFGSIIEMDFSITGDVNNDGSVDVSDVNIIIDIILNQATLAQYPGADVNGDGIVDVADMNQIINIILQ